MYYFVFESKGPPKVQITVNISNVSYVVRANRDIMINNSASAYNLSLQCSSDQDDVEYTWYFRGERVNGASIMNISNSSLESVLGTVQCMVTGVWGTKTILLRILNSKKAMIYLHACIILYFL